LPQFPFLQGGLWGYPIIWELFATVAFGIAYGAVVLAVLWPVRVKKRNAVKFVRASAHLLSSASESDQVDYSAELELNLTELIRLSSFFEDRIMPIEIIKAEAFKYNHRREIEAASYASNLLLILADPAFCRTMVKHCSWRIARTLKTVARLQISSRAAQPFIRGLAKQAVVYDESMMAREVGYHGFSAAPLLSDSLFSDDFIVRAYSPFDGLRFSKLEHALSDNFIQRVNNAAEKLFSSVIQAGQIPDIYREAFSTVDCYESIFRETVRRIRRHREDYDYRLIIEMTAGVHLAFEKANELLAASKPAQYNEFYVCDEKVRPYDFLQTFVDIQFLALEAIANSFEGFTDPFWSTAIQIFMDAFPTHEEQEGLSPFQQRLAIKIVNKLKENMRGYYPAICRVVLSCVGPYEVQPMGRKRTAFAILQNAVYRELQQLPQLAANKPEKLPDFLPDNVTFDSATSRLTHSYRGSSSVVTNLLELDLLPVSLTAFDIRRDRSQISGKEHAPA
jgi:hypothetical protein